MAQAYIGVGSNLGDRLAHCEAALAGLARFGSITGGSPVYETAPIGAVEQDAYLNAVVGVDTLLGPQDLLDALLAVEASRGRVRDVRWGPRTLDLDLLWYDGVSLNIPGLTLPHPEIRNRRFVLAPLVQVNPQLSDATGFYANALKHVSDQAIRRVSGPLHPNGKRWLVGLRDAVGLSGSRGTWTFSTHGDWANSSGDMFGAYLSAVSMFVMQQAAPEMTPVLFSHRFLTGVPAGADATATITIDRRTGRSMDAVITMSVGGQTAGRSIVSVVASLPETVVHPTAPRVNGIETAAPIEKLVQPMGHQPGLSSLSWGPLENWEIPDLNDGSDPVLRAWSPNVAVGSHDPYCAAASMLMPIDATIWPATMQNMGLLPIGGTVVTPTVEFSATFAKLDADDLFHLAEARIEHRTHSSVSGTVRLWGDDGGYLASGHSSNLVRRRT